MVFKRREKKPVLMRLLNFLWPRTGWKRAYLYVKHRLHRLPDPPHRIARGIFAGVFTSFTPFFGLHFVVAILISRVLHGNLIAAILATFFGNPVTFPLIATANLKFGAWLTGAHSQNLEGQHSLLSRFSGAGADLWNNFFALFTDADVDWSNLQSFYAEVFLPYLIGGLIPGVVAALVMYYLSVPVITVYKNRRRGRLRAKFEELRAKKAAKVAEDAAVSAAGAARDARLAWEEAQKSAEEAAQEARSTAEEAAKKAADADKLAG